LGSSVTQVALEDLRTALITLDRMVCTHLRTSHGYGFRSLTRDSHLSEEETQSANDPSYAEMPVVVLKHATGRCSDPYCDTTYRLNWTFGLESIPAACYSAAWKDATASQYNSSHLVRRSIAHRLHHLHPMRIVAGLNVAWIGARNSEWVSGCFSQSLPVGKLLRTRRRKATSTACALDFPFHRSYTSTSALIDTAHRNHVYCFSICSTTLWSQ
jgi:hypothetical protein